MLKTQGWTVVTAGMTSTAAMQAQGTFLASGTGRASCSSANESLAGFLREGRFREVYFQHRGAVSTPSNGKPHPKREENSYKGVSIQLLARVRSTRAFDK